MPPSAETIDSPDSHVLEKTIRPSAAHAAPGPPRTSHTASASPPCGRHLVDLRVAEEPDPRAIGRVNGQRAPSVPASGRESEAVEPPQEEPGLTLDLTLVDDEAPVVGDGDVRDVRDLRRRFDREPDDRIRRARRAGEVVSTSRAPSRRAGDRGGQRNRRQRRATASTRRMAGARPASAGSSALHVGDHEPRVGGIVQPVLRIALEAAPEQAPQLVRRLGRAAAPSRSRRAARPRSCPRACLPSNGRRPASIS